MESSFDVVVIGSGVAGNTAAIYLARNNLRVAIISGISVGGQLTTTAEVENFPGFPTAILGVELMQNMMQQSRRFGVEIIYSQIERVDFSQRPFRCFDDSGNTYCANFVVIATGADAKWLGLPSEEEYKGCGVSACAVCDGNFYRGKSVAVTGGSSSAGIEALYLSHICDKVYLIHRRDTFRMDLSLLDNLKNTPNVEFVLDSCVTEVLGQKEPKYVTGLRVNNIKTQKESILNVEALFVAIGRTPATEVFQGTELELDESGYIKTAPDSTRTNLKYVYAAGDVTNKHYKQAVVAASYGCIAAFEIQEDIK